MQEQRDWRPAKERRAKVVTRKQEKGRADKGRAHLTKREGEAVLQMSKKDQIEKQISDLTTKKVLQ
jgi:dihydrofolate reductase